MAIRITCISKSGGYHEDPHHAISRLSWKNEENGKAGNNTQCSLIDLIDHLTLADEWSVRFAFSFVRNVFRAARSNLQSNGRGSRFVNSSYNRNRCSTSSRLAKSFGVRTFLCKIEK